MSDRDRAREAAERAEGLNRRAAPTEDSRGEPWTREQLRAALEQAGEWFSNYAEMHRAKCNDSKAEINQQKADYCRHAARSAQPTHPDAQGTQAEGERERLEAIIERDRTEVARGVHGVKAALHSFSWLTEGRGSYEWDDDRWHKEFGRAVKAALKSLGPLEKIASDLSDSPRTTGEVQAARAHPDERRIEGEPVEIAGKVVGVDCAKHVIEVHVPEPLPGNFWRRGNAPIGSPCSLVLHSPQGDK